MVAVALILAGGALACLFGADAAMAAGNVPHMLHGFDLGHLSLAAPVGLVALRKKLDTLTARADAKIAEIKDDMEPDAVRAVEDEHKGILAEIEQLRSDIATKEAEEAGGSSSRSAPAPQARGNAPADNPGNEPADVAARVAAALTAERQRIAGIRELCRMSGADDATVQRYIDENSGLEAVRKAEWERMVERSEQHPVDSHIRVGVESFEKRAELMGEALLHRADPSRELSAGAREYRGFTLLDMAREALELRGERTRGLSRDEVARRALLQRSGYGSTSDFPIILGNVMNTTLRAAYETVGQTFRPLVRQTTVSDFKPVNRAQLGEGPAFEKVNEHGEYKRGSLIEGKESYKVATYGRIIGVTRQVIINDDMNAFGRIPQLFGQAAANLESDLVWAQILGNPKMGDNVDLFHANHKNLPTAAAFSVAALGLARALMAKQVGLDGKTVLNVRPAYLMVPVDLETKAEQELKLVSDLALSDTTKVATKSMRSLDIISEARLDNGFVNPDTKANISGSSTAWYLSAAPSNVDIIELAYLEGSGSAVNTETRFGFEVDGVEFKASLDVGAKVIDWRGLLKNAGA
jgi:hypothetical protein